jgi:hypothetical protein
MPDQPPAIALAASSAALPRLPQRAFDAAAWLLAGAAAIRLIAA